MWQVTSHLSLRLRYTTKNLKIFMTGVLCTVCGIVVYLLTSRCWDYASFLSSSILCGGCAEVESITTNHAEARVAFLVFWSAQKQKSMCVCETLCSRRQHSPKSYFSFKLKVKVTTSLTLVSFERASLAGYRFQIWSIYLLRFKSYSKG